MGRRLSEKERDARILMRKCRDMLVNQMDGYDDPDKFPVGNGYFCGSFSG